MDMHALRMTNRYGLISGRLKSSRSAAMPSIHGADLVLSDRAVVSNSQSETGGGSSSS
jgi:hypothetical protein